MSPSPEDFARQKGRWLLMPGDILIDKHTPLFQRIEKTRFWEVVEPIVAGKRFGGLQSTLCIKVRELKPSGPEENTRLFPLYDSRWSSIIRSEDRIDKPSLRER